MGKKGGGSGVNPKVEAARQRQEAQLEDKARKKAEADERREAAEWSVGANARASKRAEGEGGDVGKGDAVITIVVTS